MRKALLAFALASFALSPLLALGGGGMSLMMRRNLMAGGGMPTARDYVQDGLIAMWDGIENVGLGLPHDSSSVIWKNLVDSRYDASLIANGATGSFSEDALVCHGHVAAVGTMSLQNQGNSNYYCECVFFFPKAMTRSDVGMIFANAIDQNLDSEGNYVYNGFWYDYRSAYSRHFFSYANTEAMSKNSSFSSFGLGLHHFAGSNLITLLDLEECVLDAGITKFTGSTSTTYHVYGAELAFGATRANILPCANGLKIHSFRIYDHTLTETDRMSNYAIDKARFNLT